jgi:hypothetical protein
MKREPQPTRERTFGQFTVTVFLPENRSYRGAHRGYRTDYVRFEIEHTGFRNFRAELDLSGEAWNRESDLDIEAQHEVNDAVGVFKFFRDAPSSSDVALWIRGAALELIHEATHPAAVGCTDGEERII